MMTTATRANAMYVSIFNWIPWLCVGLVVAAGVPVGIIVSVGEGEGVWVGVGVGAGAVVGV